MSRKVDPWVRLFDVTDSKRHDKGYTVYKIVSTVFPKNCPEASTEVVVWKRFRDIKKLHKNLHSLHAGLHLKGDFPEFPKEKIFGRFDPGVIEERRRSTLLLLEFVARYSPLFTSQIFVKFFEDDRETSVKDDRKTSLSEDDKTVLCPKKCETLKSATDPCAPLSSEGEEFNDNRPCHKVPDEEVAESKKDTEDHDIYNACRNVDDVSSNVSSSTVLSLFDPLNPSSSEDSIPVSLEKKDSSNVWLLTALASCTQSEIEDVTIQEQFEYPKAFEEFETSENGNSNHQPELDLSGESCIEFIKEEFRDQSCCIVSSRTECKTWEEKLKTDCLDIATDSSSNVLASISTFSSQSFSDYLIEAARFLKLAQECESNNSFGEAFDHYKTVIGTLLSNVQDDLDASRRAAVRRKITQYLQHAEELYQKHLCSYHPDYPSNDSHHITLNSRSAECKWSFPMAPAGGLGRYKVLGLLSKVLLVLDVFTNMTHIIKALSKTSLLSQSLKLPIVPPHLRHMVQLVRYHETDDSIFLVLQHAVGGKLWTYVGSYLYGDGTRAELPLQDQNDSSSDDTNTYVGKRLLDSRYVPLQLLKPNAEPLNRNYEKEDLRTSWISSNNCSPGYVDLFSDYVASVSAKDRVPLAECQFVTYNKSRKDSRGDGCEIEHSVLGEKPSSDLITDERYDEPHSSLEFFRSHSETEQPFWDGLEHIDPKDLISNAEKLMENVEETLRNSKKVDTIIKDYDLVEAVGVKLQTKGETSPRSRHSFSQSRTRRLSDGTRRHCHRQTSDDPFQSAILDNRVGRRSSGSSLELQRNRIRHFSAIFKHLDDVSFESPSLPESCIKVWAAEIVDTLCALHSAGIVCRDLKPDNILLGEKGHVLLSYFSRWPSVNNIVDPLAKKWLYVAPEVGGIYEETPACDWWSVGALLFELLTGRTLVSLHPGGFKSHTKLHLPENLSPEASSLLKKLLCYNPTDRLGSGPGGDENVKSHSFFQNVNWIELT